MDSRPHFSRGQTAPMVANAAGLLGHDYHLLPHPVDIVWNKGTAQVLTEPPPPGTNGVGIRHPSKEKRVTTSGGSCGMKRARGKKTQHLDVRERTHVSLVRIGPIRERIVIGLVLGKPYYSLTQASRFLPGGADQVRMRNCAERLETPAPNRLHHPG